MSGAVTVIESPRLAACAGVELSLTPTAKLKLPALVGVPEITPPPAKVSPGGRTPRTTLHVYGGVPPLACSKV